MGKDALRDVTAALSGRWSFVASAGTKAQTVGNRVSNTFAMLEVASRAQAIAPARGAGMGPLD